MAGGRHELCFASPKRDLRYQMEVHKEFLSRSCPTGSGRGLLCGCSPGCWESADGNRHLKSQLAGVTRYTLDPRNCHVPKVYQSEGGSFDTSLAMPLSAFCLATESSRDSISLVGPFCLRHNRRCNASRYSAAMCRSV